ncbi:MAG: hypothetical protein U7123_06725 [Potamolinea sp.]
MKSRLVIAALLILVTGCSSEMLSFGQNKTENKQTEIPQPIGSTRLKDAVENLRVIKIKTANIGRLDMKEYGENVVDVEQMIENAYGNPKAVAAVKSAIVGHKLAAKFWKCEKLTGYDAQSQCRDDVLKDIFRTYPDIETQAKAAVKGENLDYMSLGIDRNALLEAIWAKTGAQTDTAVKLVNPTAVLEERKPLVK